MKVIHKSAYKIPQSEIKLQLCNWGGFEQVLLSTIPVESNMTNFWDKTLKKHHKIDELVSNEYNLKDFPLSYEDLVWLGKLQYSGHYDSEDCKFSRELMKKYGISLTIANDQVIELRLLDNRYI